MPRTTWNLARFILLFAVAAALPASPYVAAQVQKAAAPAGATTTTVKVEMKKGEAKKEAPAEKVKGDVLKAVVKQRAVAVAAPAVNLDPQIQQWTQQFRPVMRSEYYFIRKVCGLTPAQRTAVAKAAERSLRDAAKAYAEAQMRPAQFRAGFAIYPNPRDLIAKGLSQALEASLTPDQLARYRAEAERRAADRRRAAVRNIVAKLDQDLVLSQDQREKLAARVAAKWDDAWCQSLENLIYGDQFYPRLPDDVVTPVLDDAQKKAWRAGNQNQVFMHMGFMANMDPQEDLVEDRELVEAREVADPARARGMIRKLFDRVIAPADEAPVPAPPAAAVVIERRVEVEVAVPAPAPAPPAPKATAIPKK